MVKYIDVWHNGEKPNKWYLGVKISGSNFYISLSNSEMKRLSKELKEAGF